MLRRSIFPLALLALFSTAARASELGADGRIHFDSNAIATYDFENAATLAPLMQTVVPSANGATVSFQPITATQLQAKLATSADAIEGAQMLHWTASAGFGLLIEDTAVFGTLTAQRISISFWGRAEGIEPVLEVTYGNGADFSTTRSEAWARIPAIRTGRETSDGFVEYSTGDIDGSVMGRPIHDLFLSARIPVNGGTSLLSSVPLFATTNPNDGVSIDAIEILPAAGSIQSASCTQANEAQMCGATGACFYGACVDSAVVWHPVPPLSMQQEIVARVNHWFSNFLGDRSALARVDSDWLAATSALASASATPKSFWGGLNRQFLTVRDTHTHLGSPYSGFSTPFAPRPSIVSGPLDVCFGPTLNDLGDGKLAYVIWKIGANAPAALKAGDVVSAIDGEDPKTWVDAVYDQYVAALPVVQGIEWAPSAQTLATLLAAHASTLTVSRCTPGAAGSCVAQTPINVAMLASNAITSQGTLSCTPRFTETVAGSHNDSGGGDAMLYAAINADTIALDFDGFSPTTKSVWTAAVDAAFALPHTNVIVDARLGHGGMNALGDYLNQQFRGTGAPAHLTLAARGSFSDPNAASLFAFEWTQCPDSGAPAQCSLEDIYIYAPKTASPPGLNSKVAWLNTQDWSNNDMVPRLMSGRANLQIFAPFSTYGALGSDVPLPALVPNWTVGSIAASDGRYGATVADTETAAGFQSGTGVSPDQVVTETVSDVLAGKDTIVNAANTWLAQ